MIPAIRFQKITIGMLTPPSFFKIFYLGGDLPLGSLHYDEWAKFYVYTDVTHTQTHTHRQHTCTRARAHIVTHTRAHTHTRSFYTHTLLRTDVFTQKRFYTQTLSHTQTLLHTILLHIYAFTDEPFRTNRLLHSNLVLWETVAAGQHSNLVSCERVAADTVKSQFEISFNLTLEPHFVRKDCRRTNQTRKKPSVFDTRT